MHQSSNHPSYHYDVSPHTSTSSRITDSQGHTPVKNSLSPHQNHYCNLPSHRPGSSMNGSYTTPAFDTPYINGHRNKNFVNPTLLSNDVFYSPEYNYPNGDLSYVKRYGRERDVSPKDTGNRSPSPTFGGSQPRVNSEIRQSVEGPKYRESVGSQANQEQCYEYQEKAREFIRNTKAQGQKEQIPILKSPTKGYQYQHEVRRSTTPTRETYNKPVASPGYANQRKIDNARARVDEQEMLREYKMSQRSRDEKEKQEVLKTNTMNQRSRSPNTLDVPAGRPSYLTRPYEASFSKSPARSPDTSQKNWLSGKSTERILKVKG